MSDMTAIDWDRFAARVMAGTRVRAYKIGRRYLTDGFLLENQPWQEWESRCNGDFLRMADFLRPHKQVVHAKCAEYRVGTGRKKWLTFDELMA